jgi:MFS family permease
MSFMMTAAPLAMVACGFAYGDAGRVIQWHVLAMFIPSFFTGWFIQRLGIIKVLYLGAALYVLSSLTALSGQTIYHFGLSMVLLGAAWNFMFTGGTALLAEAYSPAEKAKVQGLNEFMVFGTTASASLAAGVVMHLMGWRPLSLSLLGILSVAFIATTVYALSLRRSDKKKDIPLPP